MNKWNSILSQGMFKPVFYNLFGPLGEEYIAVVESYPWNAGAGLGTVRTNLPGGLRRVQDIMDLRGKGFLVINSVATREWALLRLKNQQCAMAAS